MNIRRFETPQRTIRYAMTQHSHVGQTDGQVRPYHISYITPIVEKSDPMHEGRIFPKCCIQVWRLLYPVCRSKIQVESRAHEARCKSRRGVKREHRASKPTWSKQGARSKRAQASTLIGQDVKVEQDQGAKAEQGHMNDVRVVSE